MSDTETQVKYSWPNCSFCCRVVPGLWMEFWHNRDVSSSQEYGCLIFMKPTFTSWNSLWKYHSDPCAPRAWQIHHWTACIPVYSALYFFLSFNLIMFSSTLNQWTQCVQIVTYWETQCLGADDSSCLGSTTISIYASSRYWRLPPICPQLSPQHQCAHWRNIPVFN